MATITKKEIDQAKQVDLLNYVIQQGYELLPYGRGLFKLKDHDSVVLFPTTNTFYWYSKGVGGDILQFMIDLEGYALPQAVSKLLDLPDEPTKSPRDFILSNGQTLKQTIDMNEQYFDPLPPLPFELPTKANNNKKAFAYLTKTRGIDEDIVRDLMHQKTVYQSEKHVPKGDKEYVFNNVVFVGMDKDNNPAYASERSLNDESGYIFKGDVPRSNKECGFSITDKQSDSLLVAESPIDVLSLATIRKATGQKYDDMNYLSLGGLNRKPLVAFLAQNPQIKNISLCLDNDPVNKDGKRPGPEFALQLKKEFKEQGYTVTISLPKEKDYNLALISLKQALTEKSISLPEKSDTKQLYAYLSKTKGIHHDVIDEFVKSGELTRRVIPYTTKAGKEIQINSLCLTKLSQHNNPLYSLSVSLNARSDKEFIIQTKHDETPLKNQMYTLSPQNSKTLVVTDNPISMLTHKSIIKDMGKKDESHYICTSIYGIKEKVEQYLQQNTSIKAVRFIFENTPYAAKVKGELRQALGDTVQTIFTKVQESYSKDYAKSKGIVTETTTKIKQNEVEIG